MSFLHGICERGNVFALKDCLEKAKTSTYHKAVLSLEDEKGRTPLFYAIQNTQATEAASILIQSLEHKDLTHVSKKGRTPLHIACESGNVIILKLLLSKLSYNDKIVQDEYGLTPLHRACHKGHLDAVKLLVVELGYSDLNARDDQNWTPLALACRHGHPRIVEVLLDILAYDELITQNDAKWTALHHACYKGVLETVQMLIKRLEYKDLIAQTKWQNTPLHDACAEGHYDVVEFLVKNLRQEDLAGVDSDGNTPLMFALRKEDDKMAKLLLAHMDPNRQDPLTRELRHANEEYKDMMYEYKRNPHRVRMRLREELGLQKKDVAEYFSLVVGFSDAYFETDLINIVRFFSITSRLPMELQMVICNRAFESDKDTVKTVDLEEAISKMF